jgi:hypothetical protein
MRREKRGVPAEKRIFATSEKSAPQEMRKTERNHAVVRFICWHGQKDIRNEKQICLPPKSVCWPFRLVLQSA